MSKQMIARLAIMKEKDMLAMRVRLNRLFDEAMRLRYKTAPAKREKEPTLEATGEHLIASLKSLNQQERDGIKRRLLAAFRQADGMAHRYDRKHLALVDGRKS